MFSITGTPRAAGVPGITGIPGMPSPPAAAARTADGPSPKSPAHAANTTRCGVTICRRTTFGATRSANRDGARTSPPAPAVFSFVSTRVFFAAWCSSASKVVSPDRGSVPKLAARLASASRARVASRAARVAAVAGSSHR